MITWHGKGQENDSEYGVCYVVLYSLEGGPGNVASVDIFHGQTYITVEEGQYLELSRCTIVSKE